MLTTVALSLVVVGAGGRPSRVGRFPLAAEAAGLGLPLALGGLIWSLCELAGVDPAFRAVPIFAVLGLLALVLARPEVEVAAATASFFAAVVAIPNAADVSVSLAIHLTVAGAIVTTSAILRPSRRLLAWPGGALLATATWVRLYDLGVVDPEPYTLPTAVALVLVGLYRLRDEPTTPRPPRRSAPASRWRPSRRCSGSWPTR